MKRIVLIICITCIGLLLQAQPRLTVVLVVDGLTDENLTVLQPYWQQGGIRTITEEGYHAVVSYPHHIYGGVEGVATLLTGTTPSVHGIAANTYFSRSDCHAHSIIENDVSALHAPTLGDLVRIKYGINAHIVAVGLDKTTTMIMGGHAADVCSWIDERTMCWQTTDYYRRSSDSTSLPNALAAYNASTRFDELAARVWEPRLDISLYNAPTEAERKKPFHYTGSLRNTPMANTAVIEGALALQKFEHLGEDNTPDVLLLNLTTLSPKATCDDICSAEQEDMYLWLNQDIGYLIDQLAHTVGTQHLRVVMLGHPILGQNIAALESARLQIHHFNVDHVAALTSTYLMALYGTERWVEGGYLQSVYLNHTLIEQHHLNLHELQLQVANFLMEFEGVSSALPLVEAMGSASMGATVNKHTFGDVVFTLQPQYMLYANEHTPLDQVIQTSPTSPVFVWNGAHNVFPPEIHSATEVVKIIMP